MRQSGCGKRYQLQGKSLLVLILLTALMTFAGSAIASAADNYQFASKFGGIYGTADGAFTHSAGIALDASDNIYVADWGNNRIQKFDKSGNFLKKWGKNGGDGTAGNGNGEFDRPCDVAIDPSGNVYVGDINNHRVQKFDSSGNFLAKWGVDGTGDGQFKIILGIGVDSDGNVYVTDAGKGNVQKFNSSGVFLGKFGTQGSGDGQFSNPEDVVVDSNGNIYVMDCNNARVQKFSAGFNFKKKFGTSGTGDGQFYLPYKMAVDKDDNLFVADRNNSRVQKFDYNGKFITKFGTEGHNDGQLSYPEGIAIDSSGNVIISDTGNIRIDKFANKGLSMDLIKDPLKLNIATDTIEPGKSSNSFSDVPDNAWYKSYVDTLVGKGIISGYSDNTFRPGAPVARAEFSKMLALALGWQIKATTSSSFADVPAGSWASPYIEAAKLHNALAGYPDGKFNPLKSITRAEIATIIARVKGYQPTPASFTDTKGHWANTSIGACAKAGILSGYPGGIFKPNGPASRAEAAKLIAALL